MKRLLVLAAAFAVAACSSAPAPAASDPKTIEVMVLGMFHLDNPGADLHNAKIDPVTTPEKQAQLQTIADGLARFKPTAIAVERVAKDPATMLDHRYPEFKPGDLLTNADERVQVGYRLANQLGLTRVYAVDEQERDGQPSYFPFEDVAAWAEAHGRTADLDAIGATVARQSADLEERQKTEPLGRLLYEFNTPSSTMSEGGHGFYMELMKYGAGDQQPGAFLNGRWYTRNAMIFAKLVQVAKPGDRIVLIYGAGHSYWLRNLIKQMPGYRLVEATDYLPH